MENIASQFTSEKTHRLFSSLEKSICLYIQYRSLLKIVQTVGVGYIPSAKQSSQRSQLPETQPWANLPRSWKDCDSDDCCHGDKVLTDLFYVALRYGTVRCPGVSSPWRGKAEGSSRLQSPCCWERRTGWGFVGLQAVVCRGWGARLVWMTSFSTDSPEDKGANGGCELTTERESDISEYPITLTSFMALPGSVSLSH